METGRENSGTGIMGAKRARPPDLNETRENANTRRGDRQEEEEKKTPREREKRANNNNNNNIRPGWIPEQLAVPLERVNSLNLIIGRSCLLFIPIVWQAYVYVSLSCFRYVEIYWMRQSISLFLTAGIRGVVFPLICFPFALHQYYVCTNLKCEKVKFQMQMHTHIYTRIKM